MTTCGCDSITTWLLATSVVVAPIRLARKRSQSGCIVRSFLATMLRLQLTGCSRTCKPEVAAWIVVRYRLARGLPHHLESHSRGSSDRIERGPSRLIDHQHILHFQCEGIAIRTNG
jgi:hypothetical protein